MKIAYIFLILSTLLASISATNLPIDDVCIAGGGPAGMALGVALKDHGYTFKIFELRPQCGGNCDTLYFTGPDNQQHFVEMGVAAYINTALVGSFGLGNWSIDAKAFVERFLGPNSTIPFSSGTSAPQLFLNLENGQYVVPSFDPIAFQNALVGWLTLLTVNYQWADIGRYTGPITSEMLLPFDQMATQYGLDPLATLIDFFGFISGFASGNYSDLPSLYMLTGMSRAAIVSLVTGGPDGAFKIKDGCQGLYNSIATYLGSQNVVTSATITSAKRHKNNRPIKVKGFVNGTPFKYKCRNLVIAYPPTLDNLMYMNPDHLETSVLSGLKTQNYYTGAYTFEGPYTESSDFGIFGADAASRFYAPFTTSITGLGRELPFGPASVQVYSPDYKPIEQIRTIVQTQINNIPSNLINQSTVYVPTFQHRNYSAQFTFSALSSAVSPYAKWDDLQGHLKTFYVGSTGAMVPSSSHAWNEAYYFANTYFPNKNTRRSEQFNDRLEKSNNVFSAAEIHDLARKVTDKMSEYVQTRRSLVRS